MSDPVTIGRLYGRRAGHKLREGQAALVEDLLPRLSVPDGPLDATKLFGKACPLELEIGFGGGEHLAGQAAMRPDTGFIGCEPFLNGVVGALNHIQDGGHSNIRLHMGDALDVLLLQLHIRHPSRWPTGVWVLQKIHQTLETVFLVQRA